MLSNLFSFDIRFFPKISLVEFSSYNRKFIMALKILTSFQPAVSACVSFIYSNVLIFFLYEARLLVWQ